MRVYLGDELEEMIENDEIFSTANYRSRKKYSIETEILEKIIIFDHSILNTKNNIYNFVELWFSKCYATSRCIGCRIFVDIVYNYSVASIKILEIKQFKK